jgi:acyl carrier protein
MTNQEIEQKVKEILSKKLDVEPGKIALETRLAEDLGVDSFGAVELMFEIEEAFGLKIPDSEIEHVRRVGDIVTYLQGWLEKQPKV